MMGGDHRGNKIKEWMNSILNQVKSVTFAIVVPIKSGLYNFQGGSIKLIKDIHVE